MRDYTVAKQILAKASDDLDLVRSSVKNERQHDNCGYHLCQAVEKTLKFFCEVHCVEYSRNGKTGHSLDLLFGSLHEHKKMSWIAEHFDLVELDVYDSGSRYDYVFPDERLDLKKYLQRAESLFGKALSELQRLYGKR